MAIRHNRYAKLMKTGQNNPKPLLKRVQEQRVTEQLGPWTIPPSGVPDLGNMADSCQMMADQLSTHADHLRAIADMQPNFMDQFAGSGGALPGEVY